ncbi:MAG: hypothetical protein HRU38_04375 [Saccharospirillaceae bacterium]|nr:hypothetical protein [Pseudomonadales bacterium]NRB77895.1 hypothetical protein [Saccharospirillaceae bacterium]
MGSIKKILSSTLLLIILLLIFSAYWMFFKERSVPITSLHINAGVIFLLFSAWHIVNNKKALLHYLSSSKKSALPAMVLSGGLLLGVLSWVMPFNQILAIGGNARFQDQDFSKLFTPLKQGEGRKFQVNDLNTDASGVAITLSALVGDSYTLDMSMLLWVEDLDGNYIETIYSTRRFGKGLMKNPENRLENIYRQESVPHWIGQRQKALNLETIIPNDKNALPDAITGATPGSDFLINTKLINDKLRKFILKFEANQSYDWNEYYSQDRFLDDHVYSGTGEVGQPSIIYQTQIDLDNPEDFYVLLPIGHGHHSGQNSNIDPDLSNISTALIDFYRLIVEVGESK